MRSTTPPTTDELKAAWRRASLWSAGLSFRRALASPLVRRAMEMSALARRRRDRLPVQSALF